MQLATVITLTGSAGSGKNTTAGILKRKFQEAGKKYLILSYADQLRSIVNENIDKNAKDYDLEYRKHMQYLGTDVVRTLEKDFWVHQTWHIIDLLSRNITVDDINDESTMFARPEDKENALKTNSLLYDGFIIADARFENELNPSPYNLSKFIYNIKIERSNDLITGRDYMTDETRNHESEKMSEMKPNSDYFAVIWNNGTLDDLDKACSELTETILKYNEAKLSQYHESLKQIYEKNKEEFKQAGLSINE